jgi:hypothetical protein
MGFSNKFCISTGTASRRWHESPAIDDKKTHQANYQLSEKASRVMGLWPHPYVIASILSLLPIHVMKFQLQIELPAESFKEAPKS